MHAKKVLGIDPGDTTGYAFAEVIFEDDQWTFNFITTGEFGFPKGFKALLIQATNFQELDVVVIEDYIIRQPHIGQSPIAIKVIGTLQTTYFNTPVQVVLQQPVEKARFPNHRLEKVGVDFRRLRSPHVIDAIRHIAIWAQKESRRESGP